MKTTGSVLVLCLVSLVAVAQSVAGQPRDRQVAVTIDDLPAGSANLLSSDAIAAITWRLLSTLREQRVPVVGFVNEKSLFKFGDVDHRIALLRMWLDWGFELGNHTYSHSSLNHVGLRAWEDDVIKGETVTRLLLADHKMTLRYFRHPYMHTGRDLETRHMAEAFLAGRGYRIAPVTLDAWDWMFGRVYEDLKKSGKTALQQRIVTEYL